MARTKQQKLVKKVRVTRMQVDAARDRLAADRILGRESDPAVEAIARARRVAVPGPKLLPSQGQ